MTRCNPAVRAVASLGLVAVLSLANEVRGDEPTPSAAEALFREARALIAGGEYAVACPKLEESLRLDPAPGTRFNLARCYELEGRFASAWRAYAEVADAMHAAGQSEREAVARARLAAIDAHLSYVVVRVAAPPTASPGRLAHVVLDGRELRDADIGTRIPVDVGDHVVGVFAPGKRPWETRLVVRSERETVEAVVPPLAEDAAAQVATPASSSALPAPLPSAAPASVATLPADGAARALPGGGLGAQRIAAVTLLGSSAIAAGVGAYFGVRAFELGHEARQGCSSTYCTDPAALQQSRDSRSAGDAANVAFVTFGALAAAGAVLWFTASARGQAPASAVVVLPGPGSSAAVWVHGRF